MIPTRLFGVIDTCVFLNKKVIGIFVVLSFLLTGAYFLGKADVPHRPQKSGQRIDSSTVSTIIVMKEYSLDLYQLFRLDSFKTGEKVLKRIAGIPANDFDGWGRRFTVEYKGVENFDVSIRSSGADGCWNTEDDLCLELNYSPHHMYYSLSQDGKQLFSQDASFDD